MRKLVLSLAGLICISFGYAQGVSVGLKGGLNFPSLDAVGGLNQATVDNSTGYHGGPFLKIKVSKIAVQAEALYSFQKTSLTQQVGAVTNSVEQRMGYITVPVMLRLYSVAGINLQVGPQFGFLVDASQKTNATGVTTTQNLKNQLNNSDLGINFGLGIDLPFNLDLHARYVLGISDVNDVAGAARERNSQIQISLGYAFLKLGR